MEIVEFEPGELEAFAATLRPEMQVLVIAGIRKLATNGWIFESESKLFRKLDSDIWCLRLGPSLWHAKRDLGMSAETRLKLVSVLLRIYFLQPADDQLMLLGFVNKTPGTQIWNQGAVIAKVRDRRSKLKILG
jgi:hypothetical protein